MEAKTWRSYKIMVHNSQVENLQHRLLPQKIKMLKPKSSSYTEEVQSRKTHTHTPLWPTPKQNYTNSMLSKYL